MVGRQVAVVSLPVGGLLVDGRAPNVSPTGRAWHLNIKPRRAAPMRRTWTNALVDTRSRSRARTRRKPQAGSGSGKRYA
jgi:hypothetical protein